MPLNLLAITWDIASVEEAGYSTWSSLAFSPSGQPAIAYYSSLKHALRFAEQDSHGAWEVSTVDRLWCAIRVVGAERSLDALSGDALRHRHPEPGHPVEHRTADPGFGLLGRQSPGA